ncbi:hypothetical protein ACVIJ6_001928 [Bradyrhizobium sp. USDA 4369]
MTGVRRRRGALDRGQHVALGDAAVLAGAGNGGGIDAALGRELAYRGRLRRIGGKRLGRGGSCSRGCCGGLRGSRGSRGGLGGHSAIIDLAEQRADGNRLAVLGDDLAERAGRRSRHLDRHLVGFELDERLVDRHGVAGLLEPAADGGFGDGFTERRNANFSHGLYPQ